MHKPNHRTMREACNFQLQGDRVKIGAGMAANYIEPHRRFNTEYRSRILPNQIAAFEGAGL